MSDAPADREAGALLHELLDGYRSPARLHDEISELQAEVKAAQTEITEYRDQIKQAQFARKQVLNLLVELGELIEYELNASEKLGAAFEKLEAVDLDLD